MDMRSWSFAGNLPESPADRPGGAVASELPIHVLRSFTVEGIEQPLKHHLAVLGLSPRLTFGGYGTMMQEALTGGLWNGDAPPQIVLAALTLQEIDPEYGKPGWKAEVARRECEALFDALRSATRANILVNTFLPPLHPDQELWLARDGSDVRSQVAELNRFVVEYVRRHAPQFALADFGHYLARLGAEAAIEERGRYLWRAPFKAPFLDLYARDVARVARVLKGAAKKCLVLDCDNTLWGGIVGEDGPLGIKLDRHEYPGKAYYDFQSGIMRLADRGVLVALCSKNNETDVLEVLNTHPACQLNSAMLSSMKLNWQDKAANIRSIAEDLNVGLDSLVFVDDNPAECEAVRAMLPEVTVLQAPAQAHELPGLLFRDGLFDSGGVTQEDRGRAGSYKSDRQRRALCGSFATVEEYLASLNMVATIHEAKPSEMPRVAQLMQRTNQFNLTTRRHSEQHIKALCGRQDAAVFVVCLRDRFGDLGLVGVMIAEREGATAQIDSLLLSCRALGRCLERAFAAHVLKTLTANWNVAAWMAEFVPTAKNAQARGFWIDMGFDEACRNEQHILYLRKASCAELPTPSFIAISES